MKITSRQLKTATSLLKNLETKENNLTLEIINNILHIQTKKEGAELVLMNIKTDEETSDKISIKKDFLTKIERQIIDEVNLKINKKTITSKVGGVNYETKILNEEMNYDITQDKVEKGIVISLTQEIMNALIEAAGFVDTSNKRPILMGINIKVNEDTVEISATDSFKMYNSKIKLESEVKGTKEITVRKETVDFLNAMFEATNKKGFPITITDSLIYVITKGVYYKSVLLEGKYPDLNKILDKIEKEEKLIDLSFTDEDIKRLKAIETKSDFLQINNVEKGIEFTLRSETEQNNFTKEIDDVAEVSVVANYKMILNTLNINRNLSLYVLYSIFKKEDTTIVLMNLKQDTK